MKFKRKFSRQLRNILILISLFTVIFQTGCDFQVNFRELVDQIVEQVVPSSATATPSDVVSTVETPEAVAVTPTVAPVSGTTELVLWVPPQFDPELDDPANQLFKQQIAAFERSHDSVFITVRVKAATGQTGLLESLSITNDAATDVMPSLVAFTRSDLETAVTRNLLVPFDSYSIEIDNQDWYDYAQKLTVIGGSSYGLPFAGDAMMLVYRPSIVGEPPLTWTDLLKRGEPVAFPAADPQSLLSLSIYLSSGGELDSTQRLSQLDQEKLNQLFQLYADGAQAGVFPLWLTELQKSTEAWTAYNELRSNWVITWMTRHLSDPAEDSKLASFPSVNDATIPLADGWVWCLTDPNEQVHPLAVELAEFLTDADYLRKWTPLEGVLPVRPSSLTAYTDPDLQSLIGQEALTAHVRPSNEIVSSLGLMMEEQLVLILSGKTTAPFAAQAIMDRLGNQ